MSDFTIWLVTSVLIAACFKDNNIFATLIFPLFFFSWFLLLLIRSHSSLNFCLSAILPHGKERRQGLPIACVCSKRSASHCSSEVPKANFGVVFRWRLFFPPLNKRQADLSLIHRLRCVLVLLMFAHSEKTAARPAPNFPRG